jgi:predicted NBD/HSP70 family sugar kinase
MYIIFDIGGTNTRIARSRDGMTFDDPTIIPTPRDFDDGMTAIIGIANQLAEGNPISIVAGGIAGPLDRERRTLSNSPHLHGWIGKPLAERLETELQTRVRIENDTAVVGLGEAVAGAGHGYTIVAYLSVSTGVGGVRIVNGKIDVSAYGFEPGHQVIDAGGGLETGDEPPFPGRTLEAYVSGSSVTERFGKKPYEITEAAFWERMAMFLAYGVNNTIVHWSPDIVVIGGSMMKKIGIPIERVEAYVNGMTRIYPELPSIVHSELGDIGGLYGALALARESV